MFQINIIGLMSGSSLDGVDIAYVEFYEEGMRMKMRNIIAETLDYPAYWHKKLNKTGQQKASRFAQTHVEYGHYLGKVIMDFIVKNDLKADLICSHGHTIFHQPQLGFTTQIGDGAGIYAETGIPVVCDLRSMDMAFGGQGAPLVPIGERDLFEDHGMFLNLGGFANISIFDTENSITAFDIGPCNMPLNILCERYYDTPYDNLGAFAQTGRLDHILLEQLNQIPYFRSSPPKSLGKEFVIQKYLPVIDQSESGIEDKLFTITQHISQCIAEAINNYASKARQPGILVSGGGVYNLFLMDCIKQKTSTNLIIPSRQIIEFKEAIIFAYLGLLRITNRDNALKEVTNASRNTIGGALYGPVPHF